MAELLIKNTNQLLSGTDNDNALYKKGDIIYIGNDGHKWSNAEMSDGYLIIKLSKIDKNLLGEYVKPFLVDSQSNPNGYYKDMALRRKWFVDKELLTQEVINNLKDDKISNNSRMNNFISILKDKTKI